MKKAIALLLICISSAVASTAAMASPLGCFLGAEAQHDAAFRAHSIYFGHQNGGLIEGFWFVANDSRYPLLLQNLDYTADGAIINDMASHCGCDITLITAVQASGLCGH